MTAPVATEALFLPPLFSLHRVGTGDPFALAQARAGDAGAGAFFFGERPGVLGWAVVLEPETPLGPARRAFALVMAAAADALAALCLPERSVRIGWPDVLLYDTGRIGGGRLAWPEDGAPDAVPDWLVAGIELIADRDELAEPGRCPETTSLKEELFESHAEIVESFARNLMLRFDRWEAHGFDAAAEDYLRRLGEGEAASGVGLGEGEAVSGLRLGPEGDLLVRAPDGRVEARGLLDGLAASRWRDSGRGGPRL